MNIWWLMATCGAITFGIRYSFIAAEGHFQPPGWFRRPLPFVPVAALTALTAPELLLVDGGLLLGIDNPRLWAGLVAIIAAAAKTLCFIVFSSTCLNRPQAYAPGHASVNQQTRRKGAPRTPAAR